MISSKPYDYIEHVGRVVKVTRETVVIKATNLFSIKVQREQLDKWRERILWCKKKGIPIGILVNKLDGSIAIRQLPRTPSVNAIEGVRNI